MKEHFVALQIFVLIVFNTVSCKKDGTSGTNNRPPVANAGNHQTIVLPNNGVFLNGISSNDPDGTISEYYWSKISGPKSFNIIASIKPLIHSMSIHF
jgi:hypothetical protein